MALSAFHLFTCHAELYSWTLLFLRLIWKVLCVFHRSDAVSRMLKAWDCGFQQSKSACVTVMIIYFWLHWISVAFFFLHRLSLVAARRLLLIVARGLLTELASLVAHRL